MAEVKEIKTRLSLNNSTQFKAELKSIDDNLKLLAAETKIVANSFDRSSASIKNYQNLNNALSKQIEQQKIKMQALKQAVDFHSKSLSDAKANLAAMTAEFGADSTQAKNAAKSVESAEKSLTSYRTKLASAEAQLAKMNLQYSNNAKAIEELAAAEKEAGSEMGNFSQKTEKTNSTLSKIQTGLNTAARGAETLASAIKLTANSLKEISDAGIKAVTEEVKLSAKAFTEYEKAVNKSLMAVTKATTETAGSFEFEMSKVQAYSNIDKLSDDYKRLEKAAIDVGAATSKSAVECAQGLGYMSLAGWDTDKKIDSLLKTVNLAEAANMDLALTSQLVTKSMASLGLESEEFDKYLNQLIATQNNSNTSAQELMEAYITAGGMLSTLGVPMEEYMTLFGRLADQGMSGSEAGNNVSSLLINIIGLNENAAGAMEELGVSAWDTNNNFIGLTKTLELLKKALNEADEKAKATFEGKIGGKRQFKTLDKMLEGVNEKYTELYDVIENSDGILEQTTETMLDNFKGSVTILQSALEGLKISVGQSLFLPSFTEFAEEVTIIVNNLKTAFESGGVDFYIDKYFDYLEGSLTTKIKRIIPDLDEFYSKYREFFDKMSETVLDIGINIAPDFLSGIIPTMEESFNNFVMQVARRFDEFAPMLVTTIADVGSSITLGMSSAFVEASNSLPDIIGNVANTLGAIMSDTVPQLVSDGLTVLRNVLSAIETALSDGSLGEIVVKTIKGISHSITVNLPYILESAENIISQMMTVLTDSLPAITSIGTTIITALISGIMTLANEIAQNSQPIIDSAIQIIQCLGDGILQNLPMLLADAQIIVESLLNGLIENLPALTEGAVEIVMSLVEFIANNAELLINAAIQLIARLAEALLNEDSLTRLLDAAFQIVKGIADGVLDSLPVLMESVNTIIVSVLDVIGDPNTYAKIFNVIFKVIDDIIGALSEIPTAIKDFFSKTVDSLEKINLSEYFSEIGENLISGIGTGMEKGWDSLKETVGETANKVLDWFGIDFDINSPSKVMKDEIGVYLVPGIAEGIDETENILNQHINDAVASINIDNSKMAELGADITSDYSIHFSSDIEEIQKQLAEMSNASAALTLFAEYDTSDINSLIAQRTSYKSDTTIITERLDRIENMLNKATITINTRNYLYPNGQELASSVSEALLFNNAITGGR